MTRLKISCPICFHDYSVKAELAGKKIRCKECGEAIPVPRPAKKPQDDVVDVEVVDDKEEDEFERPSLPLPKRQGRSKPTAKRPRRASSGGGVFGVLREYPLVAVLGVAVAFLIFSSIVGLANEKAGNALRVVFVGGCLVMGVGFSLYGGLRCLGTAAEEDILCVILWFFVPFYSLYFIVSRWEVTGRYVAISMTGVAMYGLAAVAMHLSGMR